jgi:hypothetical protein
MPSTLGKDLISLISTRASSEDADPLFDLTFEVWRRNGNYLDVPQRVDDLIKQHGSAEQALAALAHEATGQSE